MPKISTKDKLIAAAQDILADKGLAAINSNAIAERAGVTPPTFYHYFGNKQALLRELGERLMLAQSEVLWQDTGMVIKTAEDFRAACEKVVRESYAQTRAFKGSYALLVSLRALPELRDVRIRSHVEMSQLISRFLYNQGLSDHIDARIVPARLALEFLYSMIEMLFETDFANEEEVLRLTINTHYNLYNPKTDRVLKPSETAA